MEAGYAGFPFSFSQTFSNEKMILFLNWLRPQFWKYQRKY